MNLRRISHDDWGRVTEIKAGLLERIGEAITILFFQDQLESIVPGAYSGCGMHDRNFRMVGALEINNLPDVWNYIPQI